MLLSTAAAAAAAAAAGQTLLPYIPTTILLPESNTVPLQQNVSSGTAWLASIMQ